jgi:hypothetical protein
MQRDPANRAHGAALEVVEHEQADRRRQVALLAGCVDLADQLGQRVMLRIPEISFMLLQNASSRLTLVLWPPTTIERFTTGDLVIGLVIAQLLLHALIHHPRSAAGGKSRRAP